MSCCSDVMKPIEVSSCCTPQDTTAHAARAIRESGCGCAPVVEDARRQLHDQRTTSLPMVDKSGSCCGIVSMRNLEEA